jgi:hypothetical protein
VGALHEELTARFVPQEGELVILSAFYSQSNWYVFTTRRIVSQFGGELKWIDPTGGIVADFPNFKGYGADMDLNDPDDPKLTPHVVEREIATIKEAKSDATLQFEFETWEEALLPIYAERYWNGKHRFLDKLMTTTERDRFTNDRKSSL